MVGFGTALASYGLGQSQYADTQNRLMQGKTLQQQLEEAQKQSRANAGIPAVMQHLYAALNKPQAIAAPNGGVMPPMSPGAAPSGGVSSPPGGVPAAGGVPGGAAPLAMPPMGGAGAPSLQSTGAPGGLPGFGGIDPAALWKYLGDSGMAPEEQFMAASAILKMLQPQANNAIKLDLQGMRDTTSLTNNQNTNTTRRDLGDETTNRIERGQDITALNDQIKPYAKKASDIINSNPRGYIKDPEYIEAKAKVAEIRGLIEKVRQRVDTGKSDTASAPAQNAAPQQSDVDYLKANPDQRDNFDAHFGSGAAAKILGK